MITTLALVVAFLSAEAQPTHAAPPNVAPTPEAPKIVSTIPADGARDVDPGIKEIRVTFDQNMKTSYGISHPPAEVYPLQLPASAAPSWTEDMRTWVLPVQLEAARFYRLGIRPADGRFRGANGEWLLGENSLSFATNGAGADELAKFDSPKIVFMLPANGTKRVIPGPTTLILKFDKPMWFADSHYSFAVLDADYPVTLGEPTWADDNATICTLPVNLKPFTTYKIGLNSLGKTRFKKFMSAESVPLEPIVWTFTTIGEN